MTNGELLVLMRGIPAAQLRRDYSGRLSALYDAQYSSCGESRTADRAWGPSPTCCDSVDKTAASNRCRSRSD